MMFDSYVQDKVNAWVEVAKLFGQQSTVGIRRSPTQLKTAWDTLKKGARKHRAADKV